MLTHILQPADLITLSLELQLSDNIWQMMYVSPVTQHLLASQCHLGDWYVTGITHFTLPASVMLAQNVNNGCVTKMSLFIYEFSKKICNSLFILLFMAQANFLKRNCWILQRLLTSKYSNKLFASLIYSDLQSNIFEVDKKYLLTYFHNFTINLFFSMASSIVW